MHISVVVPLYNKEATVGRCIASILSQSLQPAKVLVVDDQSTDGSFAVVSELARHSALIEIVRMPKNGGAAAARNAGARMASTEWLAFLDADDAWEPSFLEEMSKAAQQFRVGFIGAGRLQFDTRGRREPREFTLPALRGAALALTDGFWTAFKNYLPINSSANLIRRDLYLSCGGFDERMTNREDFALWAKMWGAADFAFVNAPLAKIYKTPSGLSAAPTRWSDILPFWKILTEVLRGAVKSRRPGTMGLAKFLGRDLVMMPAVNLKRRLFPRRT